MPTAWHGMGSIEKPGYEAGGVHTDGRATEGELPSPQHGNV